MPSKVAVKEKLSLEPGVSHGRGTLIGCNVFALSPPGGKDLGLTGHNVLQNHWIHPSDERQSLCICSPYLSKGAFEWLMSQLGQGVCDLYVLTCEINDPSQRFGRQRNPHFINECCEAFAEESRGNVFVGVYPGGGDIKNGQQRDPLMHSKLYISATGKDLAGNVKRMVHDCTVQSACFGSMNFSDPGLGLVDPLQQSFELLAEAHDVPSKEFLAARFSYYWHRGEVARWHTQPGEKGLLRLPSKANGSRS